MGDSLQVNINSGGTSKNTYDAIVIGSGISGGWAAKELCEAGLKTLCWNGAEMYNTSKIIPTANMAPWEFPHRGRNAKKVC